MEAFKKNISIFSRSLLTILILISCIIVQAEAATSDAIKVVVMGQSIEFPDQQPVIINSRTMVPVRLTEEFGFDVTWKGATGEIIVTNTEKTIVFKVGSDVMMIDGTPKQMDVKAQIVNDRTMIPIRFLTEPFGYEVRYKSNSDGATVSLVHAESADDITQKQLMKNFGLMDCLYPIFDRNNSMTYYWMRMEDAAARGSGKGIRILTVSSRLDRDLIDTIKGLASSAEVTIASKMPNQIFGYDIVSIHDRSWTSINLNNIAQENPNCLFLVTVDDYPESDWDKPALDNSAYFNAVNQLIQPNIIKLGRVSGNLISFKPPYDYAPKPDVYTVNTGKTNDGLALAAGAFSIFIETHPEMKVLDFKTYLIHHSKEKLYTLQPREDINKRIPKHYKLLDAHLLFESYDNDPQILNTLNLSPYTGKGIKVALIDNSFNLKGLEDKVKSQHVVSIDKNYSYQDFYGVLGYSHGRDMLEDLIDVAPNAEIYTILTGPYRYTFEGQDAKDIANSLIKAKELKVDIVSMSMGVWFNDDKDIKAAINSLTDSGILVSWFWSAEVNDNIFQSRSSYNHETIALGPDGVFMYDRFDDDYYHSDNAGFSVSGTAPRMAGILAQILETKPDISGQQIKELLKITGVQVSKTFIKDYNTIPNVDRLIRILSANANIVKELNNETPIQLDFSKKYDVMVNGLINEDVSSLKLNGTEHFTMQLENGNTTILQPCTQLVSALLLKDVSGKYYIDATFNGSIESSNGTIPVEIGINPLQSPIDNIRSITIMY